MSASPIPVPTESNLTRPIPTTKPEASHSKPKRVRGPNIYANLLPIVLSPPITPGPLSFLRARLWFLSPKPAVPEKCNGTYDPISHAVIVTVHDHLQCLWRSGFFGKGSLSRSEPTWLQRARNRHAVSVLQSDHGLKLTAEELTAKRRIERREAKIEKAKEKERELNQQLLKVDQESKKSDGDSQEDKQETDQTQANADLTTTSVFEEIKSPEELGEESRDVERPVYESIDGVCQTPAVENSPSPAAQPPVAKRSKVDPLPATLVAELDAIVNLEHLQLKPEDAFFLAYGLGSLLVEGPIEDQPEAEADEQPTGRALSIDELWNLFLADRSLVRSAQRRPDNPFVVSYVAYHHFRSLGWVVRDGIKFCVDWVLYGSRGPVGGHAEFAVCVMPVYEDPEDEPQGLEADLSNGKRSWQWLSTVNRVCSGVKKTLVLAYVIIPSSRRCGVEEMSTPGRCLKLYGVKEVVIKRFIPSRMRD